MNVSLINKKQKNADFTKLTINDFWQTGDTIFYKNIFI
jgi:hypothetical protein